MTQTQKFLSRALGSDHIEAGTRVYISEETEGISFDDSLCGAYGKLFLEEKIFNVPKGIFIDLVGPLRDDVSSGEIAEYVAKELSSEDIEGRSVEFGGDSMTYLTMEDRIAIVKKVCGCEKKPFCVIFEYDYITAEYTAGKFGKRPVTFFNDGPQSYERIMTLSLDKV